MNVSDFVKLYGKLQMPVVVCRNTQGMPVVYCNERAEMLFAPTGSGEAAQKPSYGGLQELMRFRQEESFGMVQRMLAHSRYIENFQSEVITQDFMILPVYISGNVVEDDGDGYCVLYLKSREEEKRTPQADAYHQLMGLLNAALLEGDADRGIQLVVDMAGSYMDVSRAYVFEELDADTTANTYEWCADGILPAIQDLQNLSKADYPYEEIVNSGVFVVEDVDSMEDGFSADILRCQGIRSVAFIPIFDQGRALGYVGFDDCIKPRRWTTEEILFLKSVASLLGTLLRRRSQEGGSTYNAEMLKLLMDNSDDAVYANSMDDFTLLYLNKKMADYLGTKAETLLGTKCYEMWDPTRKRPCENCPAMELKISDGASRSERHIWENHIKSIGRIFLSKDNIVRWVDNRLVHVQSSTDITQRVRQEEQLQYYASTDTMTGVSNREWGGNLLEERLAAGKWPASLCFLDLDGLKSTNDTLGHTAGDSLLKETVGFIQKHMGEDDLLCRWGGDEFLLLLMVPQQEAEEIIRRVRADMEAENQKQEKPYVLAFSCGIVPFEGESLDKIVKAADGLMYENKMEKRGKLLRRRRGDPIVEH